MARSDERGVALVMALLMVLAVSIITSSLLAVARTEAFSSLSYTSMSQVRYGAESGIHAAANHLLYGYAPPTAASATDPIADYDMTVSPVTYNGVTVMLSSDPAIASTYPSAPARAAFIAASQGALNVNTASVGYTARATLMSMRVLTDYYTQQPVTLQTWEIVGVGRVTGSGAAQVEVSSILERQAVPVFSYAAFATYPGCSALSFAGGATTESYDSGAPLVGGAPVTAQTGGNVGTNGNIDGNGAQTTINGTLSTPRAGVGNCTTNNVTAATISGWGTVEEGLVTLPQPILPPTPPPISPAPPTTSVTFRQNQGCPSGSAFCSDSGSGNFTIMPPSSSSIVSMGDLSFTAGTTVHLTAGIYEINSLTLRGGAQIVIDSGPVIIKVAGQGQTTPIDLSGGGVSNPSLNPTQLQFVYGGSGDIVLTGGSQTSALVYAPNARTSLTGGADFYGSILTGKLATATGGFNISYDRRLQNSALTAGNPTMTSFNWRTF